MALGVIGVSQTVFKFEPELRLRLERMIRSEPSACVELIEQSGSLEELREALIERVQTTYRAVKVVEAARALRELDLPEEMTLRELKEVADAIETDGAGQ
jgi:hypothetical protein